MSYRFRKGLQRQNVVRKKRCSFRLAEECVISIQLFASHHRARQYLVVHSGAERHFSGTADLQGNASCYFCRNSCRNARMLQQQVPHPLTAKEVLVPQA